MNKKLKKYIEETHKVLKIDKSTMIWDQWEGETFWCPNENCIDEDGARNYIFTGFKYCPQCGVELEW